MPAIGRIVHNEAQFGNNPIHTPHSVSPGAISALQRLDLNETTTDIALSYWLTVYIYIHFLTSLASPILQKSKVLCADLKQMMICLKIGTDAIGWQPRGYTGERRIRPSALCMRWLQFECVTLVGSVLLRAGPSLYL